MEILNITYNEIKTQASDNAIAILGISYNNISHISHIISESLGIDKASYQIYYITDNILGMEGRHDIIIRFNIPVKLKMLYNQIEYISVYEFMHDFCRDYKSGNLCRKRFITDVFL